MCNNYLYLHNIICSKNTLLEQSERLIAGTNLDFKQYLFDVMQWDSRLIGFKEARGTTKTTILLHR